MEGSRLRNVQHFTSLPAAVASTTFAVSWSGTGQGGPGSASLRRLCVGQWRGLCTVADGHHERRRPPTPASLATRMVSIARQSMNGGLVQTHSDRRSSDDRACAGGGWNGKYVVAVYSDVLGRAPDPDGLNYWTQLLDSGTAVSSVAQSIAHSDEYYANFVIKPAYLNLLGRAADEAGVTLLDAIDGDRR